MLVAIAISLEYGFFIAIKMPGAAIPTILCVLAIDLFLHAQLTYKIIRDYKKVAIEGIENGNARKNMNYTKLALTELMEGLIPIIYGISMAMAYFGQNDNLFTNIGSGLWGEKITDINSVFLTMLVLFVADTVSAVVNSICLWKLIKVNIMQEFSRILRKYWVFVVIKSAYYMSSYFIGLDINIGNDSSGEFRWITENGRLDLILGSDDLINEEKSLLLVNSNFSLPYE